MMTDVAEAMALLEDQANEVKGIAERGSVGMSGQRDETASPLEFEVVAREDQGHHPAVEVDLFAVRAALDVDADGIAVRVRVLCAIV